MPEAALSIREATGEDLEAIGRVEQSAFPPARQASVETLRKRIALFPVGCLVAELDGQVFGFITSLLIANTVDSLTAFDQPDATIHDNSGNTFYVRNLAVARDHQRRGVGQALMRAAVSIAKTLGKAQIRLTATEDLDRFYSQLGFKKISQYKTFHGLPQAVWELTL